MDTLIEKDSPVRALLILALLFLLFVGGVVGLAYLGGVFTGKDAVAANDKRIANQTVQGSVPSSAPAKP